MSGVAITTELEVKDAAGRLGRLTGEALAEVAYGIGQLMEDQARRRIMDEKTSPEGERWAPWSDAYAATREARHSLLVGHGVPGLFDSIQNYSAGLVARVGTNMVYGAIHQFGGAAVGKPGLPARPYLGLSEDNRTAIEALVVDAVETKLAGAWL